MAEDIELKLPLALTQSLIIRRTAVTLDKAVDEATALQWARELHAIITGYRLLHSVAPPYSHDRYRFHGHRSDRRA